jgi:uncharacterized membrane protein
MILFIDSPEVASVICSITYNPPSQKSAITTNPLFNKKKMEILKNLKKNNN